MAKTSKKNQFKPSITSGRQLLRSTARRLSQQRIIPRFIRQRLQRTSNQDSQIPDNRRQKTTPELQAYIQGIDENQVKKPERRAIRELAHYAYAFDIDFYKSQLPGEESEKINNLGNCLSHEMDVIHRISTFSNAKFEEVEHWIDPTFFDIWIFTEVIIGFE